MLRAYFDPSELSDEDINQYHEGKKSLDDFPKRLRTEILEILTQRDEYEDC